MKIAVYPGSFDPVTFGHLDVIKRARKIVDLLYVAVTENPVKEPIFSVPERVELLKEVTRDIDGVKIDRFDGLLIHYANKINAEAIIRGLRAVSDFEYEFQMALTNRKLSDNIETIFMMPSESYSYLSSTMIKEIAKLGGDLSHFVPQVVIEKIKKKYKE